MELLGTYSINRMNTTTYQVVFDIPDNANYNLRTSPGSYGVEIQLNNGETQPSTNYNKFNFIFTKFRYKRKYKAYIKSRTKTSKAY